MTPNPNIDLYKVLGVGAEAGSEEIKKAYRRLAKKCHPDVNPNDAGAEQRFKEISAAYDVLGNANRRAQYDAMRAGPQINFADFAGAGGGPGGGLDLGDLFTQVFGGMGGMGGGRRSGAQRGPGGPQVHWSFGGKGSPMTDIPFEDVAGRRTRGRAERRDAPVERTLRAADGSKLTQRGTDVYSDVRLSFDEALLGTVKQVSTLTGTATVKIPAGTASGIKLRLRGKGVPGRGASRGDHFVTVQIDVPKKKLDPTTQRLLRRLMDRLRKD